MKVTKGTRILLCVGLVLIILGSALAGVFNSGAGATKVSRIRFEGANGDLSGLLYMPKDASAENPKPTIIVTHGYLNSAEMQDANAIELSRRGFVVLALDQYDHGHSKLKHEVYTDTSFFGIWLPFWLNSMNDAVQYMYEQPYVLKDANGNGIIGVTGHSMGGFSSTMAMAMDEGQAAVSGVLKIYEGLTEGSDFMYTGLVGIDAATADALGGGRIMGKVCAQYDEFFFNDPTVQGGTVRHKDYVSTPDGMTFLQQTSPAQANTWYATSDGGSRIIYQPPQTHPWNHFSKLTTGYAVEFYQTAFKDYSSMLKNIAPSNQMWQFKELSECVALVGFVLLILGLAGLITALPFFNKANTGEIEAMPAMGAGKRIAVAVIILAAIIIPGLVFTPLMDGSAESLGQKILLYAGCGAAAVGLVGVILNIVKKNLKGVIGGVVTILGGGLLALLLWKGGAMYGDYAYFTAPGLNSIAFWTIGCALISLTITACVYTFLKAGDGVGPKAYGIRCNPLTIIAGLCSAVLTVAIAYGVLFLMDLLFKADFRIWTFAFKTFDMN
ncbi:MAG: alpha/beta fold hydrolase, partial [Lachnospiraceae bacterium]|nr:alpha/beta fold hydrolase [Lachnospiraceae bacterium]